MTKQQLGIILMLGGGAIVVAVGLVDLLGAGRYGGIGPVQRGALATGGLLLAVGWTLLPLGDRPA